MSEALVSRIKRVVRDVFLGGDESFPIDEGMSLLESGILDSMGLVQLATALEAEFPGLKLPDQELTHEQMGTISAIAALLARRGVTL
jgi:acyl carrier protein